MGSHSAATRCQSLGHRSCQCLAACRRHAHATRNAPRNKQGRGASWLSHSSTVGPPHPTGLSVGDAALLCSSVPIETASQVTGILGGPHSFLPSGCHGAAAQKPQKAGAATCGVKSGSCSSVPRGPGEVRSPLAWWTPEGCLAHRCWRRTTGPSGLVQGGSSGGGRIQETGVASFWKWNLALGGSRAAPCGSPAPAQTAVLPRPANTPLERSVWNPE